VKGNSPLNIDSFEVTQSILLLGSPQPLKSHQGVAAMQTVENRWVT